MALKKRAKWIRALSQFADKPVLSPGPILKAAAVPRYEALSRLREGFRDIRRIVVD
jgi:hypothetical protein